MERREASTARYRHRVVDDELDGLLGELPAVSLEGAKAVGKTETAERRAATVYRLDDPATLEVVQADVGRLAVGQPPILIDEWQRYPPAWDAVRRAVDRSRAPGKFILTGSATPSVRPTHSGAGRIVTVRMRPMTLPERGVTMPSVSIAAVLSGESPLVEGTTTMNLEGYVDEIITGGFPGMRFSSSAARRAALGGYLDRIVDTDLPEIGVEVRRPETMRRWLTAYAAATSTVASHDRIRDAATPGEADKPAKTTAMAYRESFERLRILEDVPAWLPSHSHLSRLTQAPKHHLVDPALAARLVGVDASALLSGSGPTSVPRDGTYLGALFESLATLSIRVFAQGADGRVFHFRTKGGEREVDLIVERDDHRVLAIEVKLSESVDDADVRHLRWLQRELGDSLVDAVVVTTGKHAFRREDGIAVVPLALLGP